VVAQELWIFYTPVSQSPQELPDFTILFVPNFPCIRQEKYEKLQIFLPNCEKKRNPGVVCDKKRRTIKGRKRKKFGRLHTTTQPAPRRAPWALIFGLIMCAIIVSVFLRWFFSAASDGPQETKQSLDSFEPKAATAELTREEQIASHRKEEM